MIQEDYEKIYFNPGDVVTLKQDIPNKPIMMVVRKEMNIFKNKPQSNALAGIKCRWFTTDGYVQEAIISTKDLVLVQATNN